MRDERLLGVLILPILLCPTAVSAVNTQGLAWGLEVGDRIDYTVTANVEGVTTTSPTQSVSECYVVVTSLPELPNIVISIPSLLPQNFNQSLANGTEYNFLWTAVPVGNWTLLTELVLQSIPRSFNVTMIDTQAEWGMESTQDYGSTIMFQTLRMSKSDGAMNYLKQETSGTSASIHYVIEVVRKGVLSPLNMIQLVSIVVTLASLGVIVILGVLIIWHRSSEPFSM